MIDTGDAYDKIINRLSWFDDDTLRRAWCDKIVYRRDITNDGVVDLFAQEGKVLPATTNTIAVSTALNQDMSAWAYAPTTTTDVGFRAYTVNVPYGLADDAYVLDGKSSGTQRDDEDMDVEKIDEKDMREFLMGESE